MNQKLIFCIAFLLIICCDAGVSSAAVENSVGDFDDANKTLTIYNNKVPLMSVRLISAVPDLCTFTEVFEVSNFEAYILDSKEDFTARTDIKEGSGAVTKIVWFIEQNVSYVVNITDYGVKQVEEIIYNNKTGKNETILVNRTVITGYHDETRYKDVWVDYQPYDKVMSKDQVQRIKVVYHKTPELGPFHIQTVPMFRGVECSELTWWSGSWNRRRELIINHSMVDADMIDFPVMILITQLGLNTDGNDIRITDSLGNQVAREIECYNETSGELVFFFNGTSISSTVDTSFWMYYDNPAASEPAVDSTYGSENVWDSNFVAVHHMSQSPAGSIYDSTSNDNDGTTGGSMTSDDLIDGDYGKGITFDSDDYLSLGNGATLQITSDLSLESHFEISGTSGSRTPFSKYDASGGQRGFTLYIPTGVPHFVISSTINPYNGGDRISSQSLSANTNHYLVGVYDPSTIQNIYTDGTITNGAFSGTIQPNIANPSRNLAIGATYASSTTPNNDFVVGTIYETRISNIVRPGDYILTTHNNLNNPTATGTAPFFTSFSAEEEYVAPTPTPTPASTTSVSPAQYDELDLPLILYILTISLLYLLIAFRNGFATIELSLIYLIFAFFFLLFQTITISVNYIYLTLFLLLFLISIAGITKQGAD